jgi:hypothetical protein
MLTIKLGTLIPTWHNFDVQYRVHSTRRMFERGIEHEDVETLLANGIIIEQYPDDYPLPSILLNGQTTNNEPLHAVIAINETEKRLIVITVYKPNKNKWTENFSRRKT